MGAVLSTALGLAAVSAVLLRLCSLPAAKVCRPRRRVLIRLWEGFRSFLTKVREPQGACGPCICMSI